MLLQKLRILGLNLSENGLRVRHRNYTMLWNVIKQTTLSSYLSLLSSYVKKEYLWPIVYDVSSTLRENSCNTNILKPIIDIPVSLLCDDKDISTSTGNLSWIIVTGWYTFRVLNFAIIKNQLALKVPDISIPKWIKCSIVSFN